MPVEGGVIRVEHDMQLSMVGAKVCNCLTNVSYTLRCFRDLIRLQQSSDDVCSRGELSVLHARIRFLDFELHLSYRLPKGLWQARTDEERASVAETKKLIQDAFRAITGLLLDMPKVNQYKQRQYKRW